MTVSLSTQIHILAIAPLLFTLVSILCEFSMLPDVYILLSPQEKEVHSSFWGNRCTHLAAHSSKRLNPLSVIILVCVGNTQKNKIERQTPSSLVLLVWTFDSYWWIGPISSITSSNVYTKRINNTTQTRNAAVLWCLLWYQVTLYNSNIFLDFNKCLQAIFSQLSFENVLLYILGEVVMTQNY